MPPRLGELYPALTLGLQRREEGAFSPCEAGGLLSVCEGDAGSAPAPGGAPRGKGAGICGLQGRPSPLLTMDACQAQSWPCTGQALSHYYQNLPSGASLVAQVKNPPARAGDTCSIPGRGRSCAAEQVSLCATTTEPLL